MQVFKLLNGDPRSKIKKLLQYANAG